MRAPDLLTAGLLAATLAGCQAARLGDTRSGRAIESRVGGALSRLFGSASKLAGAEITRTRDLVRATQDHPLRPVRRTSSLYGSARGTIDRATQRLMNLTFASRDLVAGSARQLGGRVAALNRDSRTLAAPLTTGSQWTELRNGVELLHSASDFGRYLLRGPGDPDRSTDPTVTRRQETYLERLLRRF